MFKNIYPIFRKKHILKAESLNNLRDFPRVMADLKYQEYSDGIIAGCNLRVLEKEIIIGAGMIKYNHILYFLQEEVKVPYQATSNWQYLKIRFLNKIEGIGQIEYLTQIYLDDCMIKEQEMELARFKLQDGAKLRYEYTNFFDYNTEFDTLNQIYVPFASPVRTTIFPQLVKTFAKEMLQKNGIDIWDRIFALSAMQENVILYEMIESYLNVRLGKQKRYTQEDIFLEFTKILKEVEKGGVHLNGELETQKKMLLL